METDKVIQYAGEHKLAEEEQALLDLQKVKADLLIQAGVAGPKATTEAVMLKMEAGHEFGFRPLFALNKVAVVQGQVFLMGEALMALVKASPVYGGALYWWIDNDLKKHDINEVPIRNADFFGYAVTVWRTDSADRYTGQFTMADAKTAGLDQKDNWQKRRVTMCKFRALGDAYRITFPDVIGGLSISAEAEDLGAEIVVTPDGDVRVVEMTIEDSDETIDESGVSDELIAEANELGDLLGYSAAKIKTEVNKAGPEHIGDLIDDWQSRVDALGDDEPEIVSKMMSEGEFDQPHNGSAEQLDLGGDE